MNKKTIRFFSYIVSFVMIISLITICPGNNINVQAEENLTKKACWISYLDFEKYLRNKNEEDFRRLFTNMCNNVIDNSLDTVIVHVRAMGDAMYPSQYYPWSSYINSNKANPGYDPLKIMVEIAHDKGLKFEAWVNPYRLSLNNKTTDAFKSTSYYQKYKPYIIEYDNGKAMILDPANKEAQQIIVNGIKEIVTNYDVDGVHFDDYFYVSGTYDEEGLTDEQKKIENQKRKNNVNNLVKSVYSTIKSIDPDCEFGISPAGNISNAREQGADVDTWLAEEGYIDYIMPQIYWTDNYKTSSGITKMFTNRCNEWQNLNVRDIPIYVGLALYRVGETSSIDLDWSKSSSNMADQYRIAKEIGYDGFALFRYEWFDKSVAKTELINLKMYIDSLEGKNTYNNDSYISYSTHVQSFGWQTSKSDGVVSGTTGLGKRLEAISISLGNKVAEGDVYYRTHVQSYGWLPWVKNGDLSGTSGQSKRMEAIQIKLTGKAYEKYDIYYRVHCQSYGWLGWAKNGEPAGSATYGKRLEAIQIKLVEKGGKAPGSTDTPYVSRKLSYKTHCQTYGWLDTSYDGDENGTTGQAKRLEAIRISITDTSIEGGIRYRTHCQTHGWLPWVNDGELSGTSGQAKRLEAIEIELTGKAKEEYDIYYRVHCQSYGWLPWVKNGETSGTYGESKRLESIQIQILPKGQKP